MKPPDKSTFAERFEYMRARQHVRGVWQEDQALAKEVGVEPASISGYKTRVDAPPAARVLALAGAGDVDPGWLAFGEDSAAPAPEGFVDWLARRRTPKLGMRPARTPAAKRRRA